MKFTIKQKSSNKRVYKHSDQLAQRVAAIGRQFPIEIANRVLEMVADGAPDIDGYTERLTVQRFRLPGMESVAGVIVPGKNRAVRLRKGEAKRTVLYVKPKLVKGDADPAAAVLWRHNPWTVESLLYEPTKKEAIIISRRVSIREAKEVEERIRVSTPEITAELRAVGREPGRKTKDKLERRVIRDLAFEVLRSEFGLGDEQQSMHWRPAVRQARSRMVPMVLKKFVRWLAVPSELRWRRRPLARFGRMADARRVKGFQKFVSR